MNPQLLEINKIISLCEDLVKEVQEIGILKSGNEKYEEYKRQINSFLSYHDLKRNDYGLYVILDSLYFGKGSYTVNLSEAQTIRDTVVALKHELYPNAYDKIFISHREKDKEQVAAFVDLLYAIGIPRPTVESGDSVVFCTSHPATYISNGARNLEEIRNQFNCSEHVFFILWYSDNYFESQACLNEAGAIWASRMKYQEILTPDFDSSKIGGLLDKQKVWFRANDKFRLNSFKEELESMFGLVPLTQNAWESARDGFIAQIES